MRHRNGSSPVTRAGEKRTHTLAGWGPVSCLRWAALAIGLAIVALLALSQPVRAAEGGNAYEFIQEYPLFSGPSTPLEGPFLIYLPLISSGQVEGPKNIAVEAPGRVWFTLPTASAIGSLVVTSTVDFAYTLYRPPTPQSQPYDLLYNRGAIWFTQRNGNKIGRLDVGTGAFQEYPIPTPKSRPTGIALAPDGTIWFLEQAANKLGRLDPATGAIQEHPIPPGLFFTLTPQVEDIAVQNNNMIWFTAPGADAVGNYQVDIDRFFREQGGFGSRPTALLFDASRRLWITAAGTNRIGRYAPGTITRWAWYNIPTSDSEPVGLVHQTVDGNPVLWFTSNRTSQVGRLTVRPSGNLDSMVQVQLPTAGSGPWGVAVDGAGHVWIAQSDVNQVAEWRPPYFWMLYLPMAQQ